MSASFTLHSSAFAANGEIPKAHTCQGEDASPPLAWGDPPAGTKSFALVVDDPDAPDPAAPKTTWVHWVLYDLPPSTRSLEASPRGAKLPAGTRIGSNDWMKADYGGPCPPIGRHRYFFRLHSLDVLLGERGHLTKKELLAAIEGHVLATAELVGTYQK